MTKISRAIAQFDYAVRLKKDPKYKDKTYVIAYRNEQEKLPDGRRRSRIAESFHIGPLQDNNSIKLGSAFLKRYPNFEGEEVFYLDNQLLTKQAYKKAIKAKMETPVEEEETASLPCEEEAAEELEYSHAIVFDHYAKKNSLLQLFRAIWKSDASKLYALLMYVCQRLGAFEHFDELRDSHYIPCGQPLSSQRISEILSKVTEQRLEEFWQAVMKTYLTGTEHFYGCALDSTSVSTYSELIEYAEWGYNKQGEALPQVNLTTITDVNTGRVIYAKEVPGSIPDVTSFAQSYRHVLNKVLPADRVYLVMDRGYESYDNMIAMLSNKTQFVMGASVATNKLLRMQIQDLYAQITDPENVIVEGSKTIYGLRGRAINFIHETPAGKVNYVLYPRLYIDTMRQAYMMQELDTRVKKAISLRQQGQELPESLWKEVRNYIVEENGVWVPNKKRIVEDRRYFGCFALWTTFDEDSAEQTLEKYRARNEIEEQFRWMKNEQNCSRMYASESSYRAVLLLNLLAASLRQQINKDIKKSLYCQEKNITSVPQVLNILAGLRIKYRSQRWNVIQPTAKRRRLLEALGIKYC